MATCFLLVDVCVQIKVLIMARVVSMSGRDIFPDVYPDWAKDDYLGAALRAGIPLEWLGCCKDCSLLEVCGKDDCGRLGFSVSVNDPKRYGYGRKI
ncbi:hypothetical protein IJI69_03530 [Candidatus Saccharibacteria bacterium]|nr:hypothetical protein [Candidatus Saccharibacteria bacterium]